MSFETHIAAEPRHVFAVIADLRDYLRWLPLSSAFDGTTDISDGPVGLGTTYVERTPGSERAGRVVAFDAPHRIAFEQPMPLTIPGLSWCGSLDIRVGYTLTGTAHGTRVVRDVRIEPRGPIRFAAPLMRRPFREENQRVVDALKAFVERDSKD